MSEPVIRFTVIGDTWGELIAESIRAMNALMEKEGFGPGGKRAQAFAFEGVTLRSVVTDGAGSVVHREWEATVTVDREQLMVWTGADPNRSYGESA